MDTTAQNQLPNGFQPAYLHELPAFLCGNAQNEKAGTGCTVIVAPFGAVTGVDVRGGGPATRETDLLKPENLAESIHAVVLSGGSAFGLAASTGVMEELAKRKIGFELCGAYVPLVSGACLFDLPYGENTYPHPEMGAKATQAAFDHKPFLEGNVGAGCGATVGKMLDPQQAMKSGLGVFGLKVASQTPGKDLICIAIVAVNALGTVCLPDGTPLAGHRDKNNTVTNPLDPVLLSMTPQDTSSHKPNQDTSQTDKQDKKPRSPENSLCTNTTIGVVLTNVTITKAQAQKISTITHDAYARTIKPVHTSADGDTIFTMASGEVEAPFDLVGILATEAMQGAILRAVASTEAACNLPAARDINAELCTKIMRFSCTK